jgi:hypothetical protein
VRLLVVLRLWGNITCLLSIRPRCPALVRHRVQLSASPDSIGAASVLGDLAHKLQLLLGGGNDDRYAAAQNGLLVAAALSYFTYEGRPRGSARDELLDVRKSSVIKDNLGVFAKSFIAKDTVLGHFPGFIRSTAEVLGKSKLSCGFAPVCHVPHIAYQEYTLLSSQKTVMKRVALRRDICGPYQKRKCWTQPMRRV